MLCKMQYTHTLNWRDLVFGLPTCSSASNLGIVWEIVSQPSGLMLQFSLVQFRLHACDLPACRLAYVCHFNTLEPPCSDFIKQSSEGSVLAFSPRPSDTVPYRYTLVSYPDQGTRLVTQHCDCARRTILVLWTKEQYSYCSWLPCGCGWVMWCSAIKYMWVGDRKQL